VVKASVDDDTNHLKLPAGVYLMRLRQAERTATSRVVVVH
jgi:hypothetical protein